MIVMKFGGSSLADAACFERVINSVASVLDRRPIVVLSAMKGTTDRLVKAARVAEQGSEAHAELVTAIRGTHVAAATALLPATTRSAYLAQLQLALNDLEEILHGIELLQDCSSRTMDLVMSFGERLSCQLFAGAADASGRLQTDFLDARRIVRTDDTFGDAVVDRQATYAAAQTALRDASGRIPIVTGFIGATAAGVTTTLGRNGSDYTASLLAAAVGAEAIEIWTDVDGVLSADPSMVDGAFVLPHLTYQEAMELSYFGAKVIHPYTMGPAIAAEIPIVIRNTFSPNAPGTRIDAETGTRNRAVTGIASVSDVALVNVEGSGMVGIPGVAARVLGSLARRNISVMMISQASSEHSICLVFRAGNGELARRALEDELGIEIETRRVEKLELVRDLAVVAIIGENMRGTPGIAGKLFAALGRGSVNVLAIAQGSSERNISLVVARADEKHALGVIHTAFLDNQE